MCTGLVAPKAVLVVLIVVTTVVCSAGSVVARGTNAIGAEENSEGRALAPVHRRVIFDSAALDRVAARWDKGYLVARVPQITLPTAKAVTLYDASGGKVREFSLWPEGATRVLIRSAAATPDGGVVIAAGADRRDGTPESFLAFGDAAGRIIRTIPTSPYVPGSVCVSPQGDVWTFGWSGWERPSSPMLRRYDVQRGEVASHLPLSIFERGKLNPAAGLFPGAWLTFTCTADRVAIYSETGGAFIEVDYDTETARLWKIGDSGDGLTLAAPWMAITSAGDAFSLRGTLAPQSGELRGLYYLERDENSRTVRWRPVEGNVSRTHSGSGVLALLGADGDALVFISSDDRAAVRWARPVKQSQRSALGGGNETLQR